MNLWKTYKGSDAKYCIFGNVLGSLWKAWGRRQMSSMSSVTRSVVASSSVKSSSERGVGAVSDRRDSHEVVFTPRLYIFHAHFTRGQARSLRAAHSGCALTHKSSTRFVTVSVARGLARLSLFSLRAPQLNSFVYTKKANIWVGRVYSLERRGSGFTHARCVFSVTFLSWAWVGGRVAVGRDDWSEQGWVFFTLQKVGGAEKSIKKTSGFGAEHKCNNKRWHECGNWGTAVNKSLCINPKHTKKSKITFWSLNICPIFWFILIVLEVENSSRQPFFVACPALADMRASREPPLADSSEDASMFNRNVSLVGWGLERSNQCFSLALVAAAPKLIAAICLLSMCVYMCVVCVSPFPPKPNMK